MGAQEMLAQFDGEAFGDMREGDAAGIGGEDRPGGADGGDALQQAALDGEVLRYGFHDPLAVTDAVQVVVEISGSDERSGLLGEKGHGFLFDGAFHAGERGGIVEIEQVHREAGVGKLGRDARTHGSGPEHRNTSKCFHHSLGYFTLPGPRRGRWRWGNPEDAELCG